MNVLIMGALLAAPPLPVNAEHPHDGRWLGAAEGGVVAVDVAHDPNGMTSVHVIAPSWRALGDAATAIAIDGSRIAFELSSTSTACSGALSDDGQTLTLDAGAETIELARSIRALHCDGARAYDGTLSVGVELRLRLVFAEAPNATWVGEMDVPAQGLHGFPLLDVAHDAGSIRAHVPVTGGAAIDARLEDGRLVGTFRQGGLSFELDLAQVPIEQARSGPRRPQMPGADVPYTARDFTAPHDAGFELAGTITIPDPARHGGGPYPTAVLVSGSGQQDRDETLLGHKPFLVIADALTRAGIAVVRYDDRGVGASGGLATVASATSADFATDLLAVVDRVVREPEIDASRLGLIGHSEGGLIAPMLAQSHPERIAFIVLLAAPAVPGHELLARQTQLLWAAAGTPPMLVERWGAIYGDAVRLAAAGAATDEIADRLMEIAIDQRRIQGGTMGDDELRAIIDQQAAALGIAWMRYFLAHDPAPVLAALRCPVLAMNGTLDLQVWHEQNLDVIERVMTSAGGDVTVVQYEGLNHLFQPAVTGAPAEYESIEITVDDRVLADMATWILEREG